jgi:uncharacterized membrane protein
MKKRSWHRLILSLFGIACAMWIWNISIEKLRDMPLATISAFTTLTVNTQYVIGAIIIFMVTGRLVYEWKNDTVSQVLTQGENLVREDRTPAPKHFDDDSIQ